MFRTLYIGAGASLIAAYMGWSWMGNELSGSTRERIPTVRASSFGTSHGRSRTGHFGSGYGYGK